MMNKEEIFSTWAPNQSVWSPWVKPVLFAHLDSAMSHLPVTETVLEVNWVPLPDAKIALVIDLPCAEGVLFGIALAAKGYRPVPLYNALPLLSGETLLDPFNSGAVAAVNVLPIMCALRKGAEELAGLNLHDNAAPVFLLDANRQGDGFTRQPGEFDNRSISFTTDFPSANFLNAQGIRRILLVQRNRIQPKSDLAHTLRRWQDGGIPIEALRLDVPTQPEPINIPRPPWFGMVFQRALASLGFRRSSGGGFGGWMPDSSAGG